MLPSDSVYMLVMIAVGVAVYALELLITKDEMLWMGLEIIKKKLK